MSGVPLPRVGSELVVDVDGMDDEGRGRALVGEDEDGFDVAIRGGFPGDRVRARVERVWGARRLVQAVCASVVDEGPSRSSRTCAHGGPCPACPLEGADPSLAIALKRARVERALEENGIAIDVDDVVLPEPITGRRQKVKLVVGGTTGHIVLGLYAPHSHALVAAHLCPYVDEAVVRAVDDVRRALSTSGAVPGESGVRAVLARVFSEGVGVVVQTATPLDDRVRDALTALVPNAIASLAVRVEAQSTNSLLGGERTVLAGPARLTPREGGPPVDVDAFAQPDGALARWMTEEAARFLVDGARDGALMVDAYAGTGPFTRALLDAGVSRVVAIEKNPDVRALSIDERVDVREGLVGDVARALFDERPAVEGLVADPARRGLVDDVTPLAALHPRRFVLVACDPDAMGRDVAALVARGFVVERVVPVDLFPATPEIETIVFMTRVP